MIETTKLQKLDGMHPSEPLANVERGGRGLSAAVRDSAGKARKAIVAHPYVSAGVVAGVGVAVGGALVIAARRRRSFFEVLMARF